MVGRSVFAHVEILVLVAHCLVWIVHEFVARACNVTSWVCQVHEWKSEEIDDPTALISVDTEAPVCGFCPPDQIIANATGSEIRVLWDPPVCTDNSGVLPTIFSERQSGSYFPVPSTTEVRYTISDGNDNVNVDCSFRITIESEYLPGREKNWIIIAGNYQKSF